MDFVLALVVLAIALAVLALPLYRAQPQPPTLNVSALDKVLAQRDGVYATLRDLELDSQLGKLDDATYHALREKYMTQATALMQQLDWLQGQGSAATANAALEQEIAARRRTRDTRAAKTNGRRCAQCGRPHDADDKFCVQCGRALN